MILIADGGSTKADWIVLDSFKNENFKLTTSGLNPAILSEVELRDRILDADKLMTTKEQVTEVHFYGAGCGTPKPTAILTTILESIFINAKVFVSEDMLGAVYAASGKEPAIVCILGTGSNSCYFDGKKIKMETASLGYTLMDEASGNYFGKQLLVDFYYNRMPKRIAENFESKFELDVDIVKYNLYKQPNPNKYLASFAKFLFDFKKDSYIQRMIEEGFLTFFECRVLPLQKYTSTKEVPVYFIGSIAYYFRDILEKVAKGYDVNITDVIQRPIDNLVAYHKKSS